MMKSLCGIDCDKCDFKDSCKGCKETDGKPFGGECIVAECCKKIGNGKCGCDKCSLKNGLIAEFNALSIADMPEVTRLFELCGAYINLEYTLPSGQKVKLWDNTRVYLGAQLEKKNSGRCYGLTADENYLLVCEYSENGAEPEIIVYKKRDKAPKADSRCGLHCTGCEYKETCGCGGCIETNGHPFHRECPVAKCCQDKEFTHCGECPYIPCELLTRYSCDPEHGDTPHGARIEECKKWAKK